MGEAIEHLDGELVVNSQELQRIQHYKVTIIQYDMYVYVYYLIECGNAKKQF